MEREDIIKASLEYKRKIEGIEGNFHNDISLDSVERAFREGASWRINSVWHKMSVEEPKPYSDYENDIYPQIPCLVYGKLSTGTGYGVRYWNAIEKCWDDEECDDYKCDKDAVEEWAYLDDLLPNNKD